MKIQPYLYFNGRCEEAMAFYRDKLGAKSDMMMRFRESPDPIPEGMIPPGSEDKVMHASFRIGESTIFASDGSCQGTGSFQGISLSLEVANAAEADRVFADLADGGQVQMPIGPTFFSPRFGMVADRFGVSWMVIAAN